MCCLHLPPVQDCGPQSSAASAAWNIPLILHQWHASKAQGCAINCTALLKRTVYSHKAHAPTLWTKPPFHIAVLIPSSMLPELGRYTTPLPLDSVSAMSLAACAGSWVQMGEGGMERRKDSGQDSVQLWPVSRQLFEAVMWCQRRPWAGLRSLCFPPPHTSARNSESNTCKSDKSATGPRYRSPFALGLPTGATRSKCAGPRRLGGGPVRAPQSCAGPWMRALTAWLPRWWGALPRSHPLREWWRHSAPAGQSHSFAAG